ncbi:peptidoglycan DD-metalloendopeptidase family protein [Actinomycetaceae bacterium TAE3-ERU4]|nr:peptidoglycan DD-metalloendopeptidase family protein [Actinomycetaceae bacterium TAE3-ERU4]
MQRRISSVWAVVLACALALSAALFVPAYSALADDLRDKIQTEQQRAQAAKEAVEKARSQVEGVDAKLGQLYVAQAQVAAQIPQAQEALLQAESKLAQSQRKLQVVQARLETAQTRLEQLNTQLDKGRDEVNKSERSLGELVRQTYRGERSSTAMELVLAGKGTAALSDLSIAAETVTRLESKSLIEVQNQLALDKSRSARQEALTRSVDDLRAEAEGVLAEAEVARHQKTAKLNSLEELRKKNDSLLANLNAKKAEFEEAEKVSQRHLAEAQDRIKKFDEQLRKQQEAERLAARKRNQSYKGDQGVSTGRVGGTSVWGAPIGGRMYVTSPWGWRIHPVTGSRRLHAGVDLSSPTGEKQYATRDGVVVESYYDYGCGNMVTISHGIFAGHRWLSRHCHLSARFVSTGQRVHRGQVIGLTGSTGRVTGPHVHFEIIRDGVSVNPWSYINN